MDQDPNGSVMGGSVLGIDLGERRLGLAVSDALGLTAQGRPSAGRQPDVVAQAIAICRAWGISEVVVGLPLNMNGSRGPAAQAAERFAAELARRGGLPVHTFDERLSSVAAERVLIEGGVRRQKRRRQGLVDQGAAVLLLQAFLDRRRAGRSARD